LKEKQSYVALFRKYEELSRRNENVELENKHLEEELQIFTKRMEEKEFEPVRSLESSENKEVA
jgi:hypothetical protein